MICRTCLFANNGHQREIARDFEAASKLARLSLSLPRLRPSDKGQANIAPQYQKITGLIQVHAAAIHRPRNRIQNVPSPVCIALLLDVANDDETDDWHILAVISAGVAHMFFGFCFKDLLNLPEQLSALLVNAHECFGAARPSSKVFQSPIGDANSADRPAIGA